MDVPTDSQKDRYRRSTSLQLRESRGKGNFLPVLIVMPPAKDRPLRGLVKQTDLVPQSPKKRAAQERGIADEQRKKQRIAEEQRSRGLERLENLISES